MTARRKAVCTVSALVAAAALALSAAAPGPTAAAEQPGQPQAPLAIKRSQPNGRTDIIKAMGNTKWNDIELKR
jgi:hypothetical protein